MRFVPLLFLAGCLNFDSFAFNPVHCSNVTEETCDKGDWDSVCVPCNEDYDWTLDYPWFPQTLDEGQTVRPLGLPPIQIRIPSDDGLASFDAYWVPSHGEVPALAQTTILYNHGNYAGVEHYMPRVRVLHELGYNVLIWDYRGYGKSEPATAPSAEEFLADARQIRLFMAGFPQIPDPEKVIVYGYSLGAVPAVEAAIAEEPCALFLEAPLTSYRDIGRENALVQTPESFLGRGGFDNVRRIADYAGPLFVFVGSDDTRFPPSSVEKIAENAAGPTELWVLDGIRHGISDIGVVEAGMTAYGERMRGFLDSTAPGCLTE